MLFVCPGVFVPGVLYSTTGNGWNVSLKNKKKGREKHGLKFQVLRGPPNDKISRANSFVPTGFSFIQSYIQVVVMVDSNVLLLQLFDLQCKMHTLQNIIQNTVVILSYTVSPLSKTTKICSLENAKLAVLVKKKRKFSAQIRMGAVAKSYTERQRGAAPADLLQLR